MGEFDVRRVDLSRFRPSSEYPSGLIRQLKGIMDAMETRVPAPLDRNVVRETMKQIVAEGHKASEMSRMTPELMQKLHEMAHQQNQLGLQARGLDKSASGLCGAAQMMAQAMNTFTSRSAAIFEETKANSEKWARYHEQVKREKENRELGRNIQILMPAPSAEDELVGLV